MSPFEPEPQPAAVPTATRARPTPIRVALALTGCLALLGAAAGVLWWQDWRYARPTPRPVGLVQAPIGSPLFMSAALAAVPGLHAGRPVLLHFFNPRCPCSRFNLDHVRALEREWGGRIAFVAVVQGVAARDVPAAVARVGLDMPAVADPDGRIAAACGVYSSPQAVVLDGAGRLYFRGNYNASRYCSDAASEYARLALDSLAAGAPPPHFAAAAIAYGCELPSRRRHG